jgi:hypothetical protein
MRSETPTGLQVTRRHFLGRAATGIGTIALASLLNERLLADEPPAVEGTLRRLHFAPKAKRVIFLFQSGGPSQLDLFDPKPKLAELSGQPMPESLTKGQRVAQLQGAKLVCVGSRYKFAKYGQAGVDVSELLPWTAKMVDDLTVIRSLQTDAINHDPAVTFFQTGNPQPGRPTMGAWLSYGLGNANRNLPAFVVLVSGVGQGQNLHARYWGSGFLPSIHQGVQLRPTGDPVLFVSNPDGMDADARRVVLDGLKELNALKFEAVGDPEIATRIEQYEMAYRMQTSVPELMDVRSEPKHVLDLYGEDVHQPGSFARNCLLARRLAERGVRFIQLYHRDWDQHTNLPAELTRQCRQSDQGGYALVQDLKRLGLLQDTIVLWSGEFGRTPMAQGSSNPDNYGRDHHMKAFTGWVAGGGFAAGRLVGATDEFGYNVVADPVHVHDLHATILYLLGIDHLKLTYRFQGRDFRLTDVHGNVLPKLLA